MSDSSGHSVSTAGDINGDGLDDLIVGAATNISSSLAPVKVLSFSLPK
jgi:hypothetical protein